MKKVLIALMLSFGIATSAQAVIVTEVAVVMGIAGLVAGKELGKPIPAHLTDACKAETVKSTNGNYSYVSFEHCLKK